MPAGAKWKGRATAEKSWGTRVAERREALGLSQTQLASIAGVDRSLISRIEANFVVPRYRTMAALTMALGLTDVEALFPLAAHPDRQSS